MRLRPTHPPATLHHLFRRQYTRLTLDGLNISRTFPGRVYRLYTPVPRQSCTSDALTRQSCPAPVSVAYMCPSARPLTVCPPCQYVGCALGSASAEEENWCPEAALFLLYTHMCGCRRGSAQIYLCGPRPGSCPRTPFPFVPLRLVSSCLVTAICLFFCELGDIRAWTRQLSAAKPQPSSIDPRCARACF